MSAMQIGRLTLRVPGLTEQAARQLGAQVALALANAGGLPEAGDVPQLHVNVVADPRVGLDVLTEQIVAALLRQLN